MKGNAGLLRHGHEPPPPLFILAPPRCFTSLACAMLGQHPQAYGLPEIHLFSYETVAERDEQVKRATYPMNHGLLRAVAQVYFGAQNEVTIQQARQWLRARSGLTTDALFNILADRLFPRVLIDKSPSMIYDVRTLERISRMFPQARFIHLLRHPRGFCESIMRYLEERRAAGPVPLSHWLLKISTYSPPQTPAVTSANGILLDPQNGWYAIQQNICGFLRSVPSEQWMRILGEDLLADPDAILPGIVGWLGLRTDAEAIEEMKHPERSPYAFLGPPGARYGGDKFFLQNPKLRPGRIQTHCLNGPLSWRAGSAGFHPEIERLAREFGYT
jgi:hypothetical protein